MRLELDVDGYMVPNLIKFFKKEERNIQEQLQRTRKYLGRAKEIKWLFEIEENYDSKWDLGKKISYLMDGGQKFTIQQITSHLLILEPDLGQSNIGDQVSETLGYLVSKVGLVQKEVSEESEELYFKLYNIVPSILEVDNVSEQPLTN